MPRRKRIGVNAWVLRNKNYDGIGYFTIYTTIELCIISPELDFYVFVDWSFKESFFDEFKNCKVIKIFPPRRHPILYIMMMELFIPIILKYYNIERFIGMDGMLSLCSNVKQIPVLHDLNFHHFPMNLPFKNRIFYNSFFKKYAQKADEIITTSEFSKNDIKETYNIESEKIHVVYCGVSIEFKKIEPALQEAIKNKYSNGDNYFVSLGTIHPRKNTINLIRSFDLFKRKTKSKIKLILIGKFLWDNVLIIDELAKLENKESIVFAGRLDDEETQLVLGSAKGLIFISLFEGFGIPILEAFGAEIPVICSNTTSLKEIGGDAAIKVDPNNIDEIASAMNKIDQNENLSSELIQKGIIEKRKYSWEKTGLLIKMIIDQSLENE